MDTTEIVATSKFPLKKVLLIAIPTVVIGGAVLAFSRGFFDGIGEAAAEAVVES